MLLGHYVYSRAGGAHGSSGSSGSGSGFSRSHGIGDSSSSPLLFFIAGIIAFAVLIYMAILAGLISFKNSSSLRILNSSSAEDKTWNLDYIKKTVFEIYKEMQYSWEVRSLHPVKKIITDSLHSELQIKIDELKQNNEKNILRDIVINEITIISTQDYKDNNKDAFTALIYGSMVDYGIHDKTGEFLYNEDKISESFSDCYEFIRKDDKWILNKLYNDVNLAHVMDAINYKEK